MFELKKAIRYGLGLRGLSQRQLAKHLGMTVQHVNCMYQGRYDTTFATAEKMASIFGVALSEFVEWGEI